MLYSPLDDPIVALTEMAHSEWRGDRILAAINMKLDALNTAYLSVDNRLSKFRTDAFAKIALVFTCFAIGANVAQVMGTVDPIPEHAVVTFIRLPLILLAIVSSSIAAVFWYRARGRFGG